MSNSENGYDRTKIGSALYSVSVKWAGFLAKHMWLWWALNLTWGLINSLVGAVMFWFMAAAAFAFRKHYKPSLHRYGPCVYLQFGDNWGGLECNFFFLVANDMGKPWTEHTKQHEFGHSAESALFGPFAAFLCYIPSVARYWYQTIRSKRNLPNVPYDAAWFEGAATDGGALMIKRYATKR